jgi:adenosylcobinamide-phosphate synthase
VLADELMGDPRRGHPVAAFGSIATRLEGRMYRDRRLAGALHTFLLVVPLSLLVRRIERRAPAAGRLALLAACGWAALGGRSLRRTAARMGELVDSGDLQRARALAPSLVGRRPDDLDGSELVRAALESLAENTADAVAGPLLYGALGGAAGVVAHRAVNTLDAMVGYRSARYRRFGWAAARLDDLLGWPVARMTAAATVVAAGLRGEDAAGAIRIWRSSGAHHPSPNAGRVEAAFAGALNVTLGGANEYGGQIEERPLLGTGPRPDTLALRRGVALSATSGHLMTAAAVLWAWR